MLQKNAVGKRTGRTALDPTLCQAHSLGRREMRAGDRKVLMRLWVRGGGGTAWIPAFSCVEGAVAAHFAGNRRKEDVGGEEGGGWG